MGQVHECWRISAHDFSITPAFGAALAFGRLLHQHLARCAIGVAQDDRAALLAIDWYAIQVVVADNGGCCLICFQLFYASGLNYNRIVVPIPLGLIGFFSILVHHIDCL